MSCSCMLQCTDREMGIVAQTDRRTDGRTDGPDTSYADDSRGCVAVAAAPLPGSVCCERGTEHVFDALCMLCYMVLCYMALCYMVPAALYLPAPSLRSCLSVLSVFPLSIIKSFYSQH